MGNYDNVVREKLRDVALEIHYNILLRKFSGGNKTLGDPTKGKCTGFEYRYAEMHDDMVVWDPSSTKEIKIT